jgi:hypothetical protein
MIQYNHNGIFPAKAEGKTYQQKMKEYFGGKKC